MYGKLVTIKIIGNIYEQTFAFCIWRCGTNLANKTIMNRNSHTKFTIETQQQHIKRPSVVKISHLDENNTQTANCKQQKHHNNTKSTQAHYRILIFQNQNGQRTLSKVALSTLTCFKNSSIFLKVVHWRKLESKQKRDCYHSPALNSKTQQSVATLSIETCSFRQSFPAN